MSLKLCSLFSGSSGNATYIGTEKTHILIDAGLTGSKIAVALKEIDVDAGELDAILISHEHSDHISAAGVLSREFNIPIYANQATWEAMEKKIGNISPSNVRIFYNDMDFYIKDINIQPYKIPHDAADPVGFCLFYGNKKISIATDLGHTNTRIIKNIMDSDIVILEANHDPVMLKMGSYPWHLKRRIMGSKGHLSNEDAGHTIVKLTRGKVTHVLLAHLSKNNNIPELAYQTVTDILQKNGIRPDRDVVIDLTYRDRAGNLYFIR